MPVTLTRPYPIDLFGPEPIPAAAFRFVHPADLRASGRCELCGEPGAISAFTGRQRIPFIDPPEPVWVQSRVLRCPDAGACAERRASIDADRDRCETLGQLFGLLP